MSFRAELGQAVRDGVLIAVKWIVGLALVAFVSYGVINDYLVTRIRANRGEAAAAYLDKVIAEQQKAQAAAGQPVRAPDPAPAPK